MAQITNTLLKQAIADAEAVRETAVANAKLVLEEAITPQIREMIARRLRVEAMEAEEGDDVKTEAAKELPHQEGEPVGGTEFPADTSTIGGGENKEPSDDAFDASGIGDGGENKEDSHTDWYDDWSDSDFDLDEVIRELEEDIAALSEAEDNDEEEDDVSGEEEKAIGHAVGKHEKEMHEEKDEEMDDAPAADAKPNPFKKDETQDMSSAGEEMEADDDEDIDLEEILAELEADEEEMAPSPMMGQDDQKKKMATELVRLKNELAQYRAAVNELSGRLNEVNLLNAKLLFTNKMFRNQGLTNEQKVRIVESFDRATTIREVKLVYTALVENLSTQAKTFNTNRKKIVAEGLASKATPTTAPKKTVIVENTVAKRLQQLAGIL